VGRTPKKAWIVFSQGLLDRLEKNEIQAVAAHEMTHIINKDTLLMMVIVVFIGIITTLGEMLIRVRWSSNSSSKK
jgi:heat shock protein HtpX